MLILCVTSRIFVTHWHIDTSSLPCSHNCQTTIFALLLLTVFGVDHSDDIAVTKTACIGNIDYTEGQLLVVSIHPDSGTRFFFVK